MIAPTTKLRWAILQPQRRAILPWRRCVITGHRIGFGERFNEALQVHVTSNGWQIRSQQETQYISNQGQAILVLQGNEPIEEVSFTTSGKRVI